MRIALVQPPLTQLNTPYPATAYLTRFLLTRGIDVCQRDLGAALVSRVFSAAGLAEVFDEIERRAEHQGLPEPAWRALALRDQHTAIIDSVIRFLSGQDRTLAPRIARGGLLLGGPRLDRSAADAFGPLSVDDRARYRATLYLEDLADLITSCVDPGFAMARYQHHLAGGPVKYGPIAARLANTGLIDGWLDALTDAFLTGPAADAQLVGISVPFPGTLYAALRIGRRARAAGRKVALGGGYISTELRDVDEDRLWECTDTLSYDDGEGPLLALIEHYAGGKDLRHRTRSRAGMHDATAPRPQFVPAALYDGLDLDQYLQVADTLNPTHRLWSDGRWNKITLAHGCYWRRCAFCDVQLDYIRRYEPARVTELADHIAEVAQSTGTTGFHFVDEAAPPRLLRDLALELLQRDQVISWWGNIRFEHAFTPDLARLLAASGLIAVTGGLEVASDRLLKLMDKGVTIEQAAAAAGALSAAGIQVHAYLMYGFPTQTEQETVDALEVVRQLFNAKVIDSAFWHRFVLTRHSAVYADPERFGVRFTLPTGLFATNDIPHEDPSGADHDRFDAPLDRALRSWMRGDGLDQPAHSWFDGKVRRTREPPDRVRQALKAPAHPERDRDQLVWIGGEPLESDQGITLISTQGDVQVRGDSDTLDWLSEVLQAAAPGEGLRFADARAAFPGDWDRWARQWKRVRRAGLLLV